MDIGLQIKKFREQQKISQEELALKIFVSRQTISNWETNETQQEIGKRNYQKIIFAFIAGVIALIICFVVIFICSKIK